MILSRRENPETMTGSASCDTCAYFMYDEEFEEYVCDIDMDEDDYGRLMSSSFKGCPYYRDGDEYKLVRHQI